MAPQPALYRIVTPEGWAVLPPGAEATLWPPVDLPKARALDTAGHRALIPISITVVKILAEPSRGMYELRARRRYQIAAARTDKASQPPRGVSHELRIYCGGGPCDLSPLYMLALPRGATAVIRGYIDTQPTARWAPAPPPEGDPKAGLDILADPRRAQLLIALVYDKSRATRQKACTHELWTPCPGQAPGRYTTAALHALRLIAHFLPNTYEE
jgi:hypothetical protein